MQISTMGLGSRSASLHKSTHFLSINKEINGESGVLNAVGKIRSGGSARSLLTHSNFDLGMLPYDAQGSITRWDILLIIYRNGYMADNCVFHFMHITLLRDERATIIYSDIRTDILSTRAIPGYVWYGATGVNSLHNTLPLMW